MLGRRIGWRIGMHVRTEQHAVGRAGFNVDMRINAALRDQSEARQALQKFRADLVAFAKQNERFGGLHPRGQGDGVGLVVRPDGNIVIRKFAKTGQTAKRIEPVVENMDLHAFISRPRQTSARRHHPPPVYAPCEPDRPI